MWRAGISGTPLNLAPVVREIPPPKKKLDKDLSDLSDAIWGCGGGRWGVGGGKVGREALSQVVALGRKL